MTLGKRTRRNADAGAAGSTTSAKRQKRSPDVDTIVENDENQDPVAATAATVPQTPSKAVKTWVLAGSRKPPTPRTPRHRDVATPNPSTPRHVVVSMGKLSKKLTTPTTPVTPSSIQSVYALARQLFTRGTEPMCLVGREKERGDITRFLERCNKARPSGCLYISGPPGTGKSAMVHEITEEVASASSSIKKVYVNCMRVSTSKDLYATILNHLTDEENDPQSDLSMALQNTFCPTAKSASQTTYLVVLDEMDHIVSLDLESLYSLFEWALQKSSRLVLVGIANALDLTDRLLPRLASRNLKPNHLPILPYTSTQIKEIIASRLRTLLPADYDNPGFTPFIHPTAIELCSRKVASHSGDLRRAFEVCRRAIDMVEMEVKESHQNDIKAQFLTSPSRAPLGENRNFSTPSKATQPAAFIKRLKQSLEAVTVENAPRVTISHLNKVTTAAFSSGSNQRLRALNLQQKAALCSLVAVEKQNREACKGVERLKGNAIAAPTVKSLYKAYCTLCTHEDLLHPLSASEFREVVGSLEALSLVSLMDGRGGSLGSSQGSVPKRGRRVVLTGAADERRVSSCIGEQEMENAVDGLGSGILRRMLAGDEL